ncbi:hypothetical protein AQF52_8021 [Streptomyces venezuelae]|nr:hypothetical protein AQF52_8021 [Streptomyces venezuelae]
MPLPHLLLDIDGVLIPFPAADGSTPATHVRHTVLPTGRASHDPVPIWLDPAHGPMRTGLLTGGLVAPVWCTSWRNDATTIVGPLLGLPEFPHLDLPRPKITTSHPNGYLWKRDHVEAWLDGGGSRLDRRRLHGPRSHLGRRTDRPRPPHAAHPARPAQRPSKTPCGNGSGLGNKTAQHRDKHIALPHHEPTSDAPAGTATLGSVR